MRYWTSDLHLGHQNIIRYCQRPYRDIDHMNHGVIQRVNNYAGPNDELWILGDACLGNLEHTLGLLTQLTAGSLVLVAGNHDRVHPSNKQAVQTHYEPHYASVFDDVITTSTSVRIDEHPHDVLVNHFPYRLSDTEYRGRNGNKKDRYLPYRPIDSGNWLLCGHVHDAWAVLDRQINVGIDAWHRPLSDTDISTLIQAGPQQRPALPWPPTVDAP